MAGFILGDMNFVSWVQADYLAGKGADKEIPQLKTLRPKVTLEMILQGVCAVTGSTSGQIRAKGGKGNQAREMAIYLARDLAGLSGRELGEYFGGMSGAAITMRYKQFSNKLVKDKNLQRLLSKTKTNLNR